MKRCIGSTQRAIPLFGLGIGLLFGLSAHGMERVIQRADQDRIAQNAAQYGYKTAHNIELTIIVSILNDMLGYKRFAVPAFYKLSHDAIASYLKGLLYKDTTVYDYLMSQWALFVQEQKKHAGQTLSSAGCQHLHMMQEALKFAFEQNTFKDKKLEEYLSQIKGKVIVRSTDIHEDTKKNSLAGANESVGNLDPTMQEVSRAIGVVLASYVSEKSLGQRLAGKDDRLFDEPFMAVLIQKMVGLTGIPISGVLFTQEAEGRTPGVTDIRTVWGLNDGLVNSLVPFDTYYIGPSKKIFALIGNKHSRIAPGKESGTIEQVANAPHLHNKPCLTKQLALDLKLCAEVTEKYYDCPQDVELVIEGDTINLVQTRPITYDESVKPSYIKTEKLKELSGQLPVHTISAAGGAVRVIQNSKNIIVEGRILTALKDFIRSEDKDALQGVVIGEKGPATSHEGTVFRANGKAIEYTPSYKTVREWVDAEKFPLLIDTQRGLIVPRQEADSVDGITPGWYVHPIPQKVSVVPEFMEPISQAFWSQFKEYYSGVATSQLFELMKRDGETTVVEAQRALYSFMHRLAHRIKKEHEIQSKKTVAQSHTNSSVIRKLTLVFKQACSAAQELNEALSRWEQSAKTEQDRLACLYPVTFLESLVKQVPEVHDHVNDYSVGSLLRGEKQESESVQELELSGKPYRAYIAQYAKLTPYAITQDYASKWKLFLKQLADIDDERLQGEFASVMGSLAHLDVLPLWLNLCFPRALEKNRETKQLKNLVQILIDEYQKDAVFLKELHAMKKALRGFNGNSFEDPKNYTKVWAHFTERFSKYFLGADFLKSFQGAGTLGKIAALDVMKQFVNTFDLSIKALKRGESQYSDTAVLITRFKEMVRTYYDVLKLWFDELKPSIAVPQDNVSHYFETIERLILEAPLEAQQLLPNTEFSVARYVLGAARGFRESTLSRGESPTLENTFSLIHQGLLSSIASLAYTCGIGDIPCPEFAQDVVAALNNHDPSIARGAIAPSHLIGIEFTSEEIKYSYNWPVAAHGITFVLTVGTHTKTARLSFEISHYRKKAANGGLEDAEKALRILQCPNMSFIHEPSVDGEGTYHHEVAIENFGADMRRHLPAYLSYVYLISIGPVDACTVSPIITILFGDASEAERRGLLGMILEDGSKPKFLNLISELVDRQLIPEGEMPRVFTLIKKLCNEWARASEDSVAENQQGRADLMFAAGILLNKLVLRRYEDAYSLALEYAQLSILDLSVPVSKDMGVQLFSELFKKSLGYKEGLDTAKKALSIPNATRKILGLRLLTCLVEKGYAEACESALAHGRCMQLDEDRDVSMAACHRLLALAGNDEYCDGIEKMLCNDLTLVSSANAGFYVGMALRILKRLFVKNRGFETATRVCALINSGNHVKELLELVHMLVQKKHAQIYPVAHSAAASVVYKATPEVLTQKGFISIYKEGGDEQNNDDAVEEYLYALKILVALLENGYPKVWEEIARAVNLPKLMNSIPQEVASCVQDVLKYCEAHMGTELSFGEVYDIIKGVAVAATRFGQANGILSSVYLSEIAIDMQGGCIKLMARIIAMDTDHDVDERIVLLDGLITQYIQTDGYSSAQAIDILEELLAMVKEGRGCPSMLPLMEKYGEVLKLS